MHWYIFSAIVELLYSFKPFLFMKVKSGLVLNSTWVFLDLGEVQGCTRSGHGNTVVARSGKTKYLFVINSWLVESFTYCERKRDVA